MESRNSIISALLPPLSSTPLSSAPLSSTTAFLEGPNRDLRDGATGHDDISGLGLDLGDLDADAGHDELDLELGFGDICLDDFVLDPGP